MRSMPLSFRIAGVGTATTTTASTAARVAIPNDEAGQRPKYIRVSVITATGALYVRPVAGSGVSAPTTADCPVTAATPLVLTVGGDTHLAYLDDGTIKTFVITPLADQ